MNQVDPRLNAYRADLADARLAGRVEAARFSEGSLMRVVGAIVPVQRAPRFDARQVTQALMGENIRVFDIHEGWAWGQLQRDGYTGYLAADALVAAEAQLTHRIAVPSTFIYPEPDLKSRPATAVTMNARVAVSSGDEKFARLANGGFVFAAHLKSAVDFETDFTAIAEMFLHAPYYWGGKSIYGLDCSGLVQLALEACGRAAPRDSDMQERDLGVDLPVDDHDGLKRGDLIFWSGHVGIMRDAQTLLHANGFHMLTVAEPLREAVRRIAATGQPVTSIKRL